MIEPCGRLALAALVALVSATGCTGGLGPEDNPTEVTDSTGLVFGWDCGDDGCDVEPPVVSFASPCTPADSAGWTRVFGRFVEMCVSCGDGTSSGWITGWCRPIVCERSSDCPAIYWLEGQYTYECESGLCQNTDEDLFPREPLNRNDAEVLCFADVPRDATLGWEDPARVERIAMLDESCGTDWDAVCEPPPECAAR